MAIRKRVAPTGVGIDTPQMEAFFELWRAQDVLTRTLDQEMQEERAISITEYLLLLTLRYAPEGRLLLGELAARVHLTKSGVTRLVDRMEDAGFVDRVPCPTDKRSTFAAINAAGRAELRRAWPVHRRGIESHFGEHFTTAEAAELRDLLVRIV